MSAPDDASQGTRRFNLFDLFVAVAVVSLAVLTYYKLSAPHRVAPPYSLQKSRVTVEAALQLPAEQDWICEFAVPGQYEIDPRTGGRRAEVLDCTVVDGRPVVLLKIHGLRDRSGRLLFEGAPLVPGRVLQLNTSAAILEGVVRRVDERNS